MATSVITAPRKAILKQNNNIGDKENRDVTLSSIKLELPSNYDDDDSQDWTESIKQRSALPNYVTNADGGNLRRRQIRSPAPAQASAPSHVIARRNERERNRVRQVNDSFAVLRSRIPHYLYDESDDKGRQSRKKLSKVETLRLAVDYIQKLETLLNIKPEDLVDDDTDSDRFSEDLALSTKSEFKSEVDALNLSRDEDDLSSDVHSTEEKPYLSSFSATETPFPGSESVTMEGHSVSMDTDERSSDLDGMQDDDYSAENSPLPPIVQSFPSRNLGYSSMFLH